MKIKKKTKYKLRNIGMFLLFIAFMYGLNLLHLYLDKSDIEPNPNTTKYKVRYLYAVDGDTAVFRNENNEELTCRFLAVDAPEIDEEKHDEARSFTDNILRNAYSIILELEPRSETHDKFERLLAWVWADNKLVQAELVKNDLAVVSYLFDNYLYTDYLFRINSQKNVTK